MTQKLFRFFDEAGNAAKLLSEDILDKASGKTLAQHMADADCHPSKTTIDEELAAAINGLKNGEIKTLSDSLASTHQLVDDFINGEATDDGVMNRLVELVTQINNNKETIDQLLDGKLDVAAIVNDLTTGGVDKVLSAEQGKTLKGLIEALEASVAEAVTNSHTHSNKTILDGISTSESSGNLVYNNKELTGESGIAYGTTLETATAYNGKLRIVVEDYAESAD